MVKSTKDLKKAQNLLATNFQKHVLNGMVAPSWINQGEEFSYVREEWDGTEIKKEFIIINPLTNKERKAFNQAKLAKALTDITGTYYSSYDLPFNQFEYINNQKAICFEVNNETLVYDLKEAKCETLSKPGNEIISPNRKYSIFVKSYNLYMRDFEKGITIQLTFDGVEDYGYGIYPGNRLTVLKEKLDGTTLPPALKWSPDSHKIFTYRLDQRKIEKMHLVQSVPITKQIRPILHSYHYPLPGDNQYPKAEMVVLNINTKEITKLDTEPLILHNNSIFDSNLAGWINNGNEIYFSRIEEDHKTAYFSIGNIYTGEVKEHFIEKSNTFLHFDRHNVGDLAVGQLYTSANIYVFQDGEKFIWHSERDGRSHLYLYDSKTGNLIRQLTSGQWAVRRLIKVDEVSDYIYFTASGKESGRDPYYQHLYRLNIKNSTIELLTPEDAEHTVIFSPNLQYFIDTYSRVDLPPVSILRAVDGKMIRKLEEADIEKLISEGYQIPKKFTVKARDGKTDLYGVMVLPENFDSSRKYPLIDYMYGGFQRINTPKAFTWRALDRGLDPLGGAQSLAQLGFITMIIDGMGTPYRNKAFYDVAYGKLEEASGLEDHVLAIKQLAEKHSFIDINRIGAWGLSAGGYASTRALCTYPDFYKVAVSACGNHDNRMYNTLWSQRYLGSSNPIDYENQDNAELVVNLKGKLLLVHGDTDDNVHPSQTIRLIDALIKENKDFDQLIMPNRHHAFVLDTYFLRKKWEYFMKHL